MAYRSSHKGNRRRSRGHCPHWWNSYNVTQAAPEDAQKSKNQLYLVSLNHTLTLSNHIWKCTLRIFFFLKHLVRISKIPPTLNVKTTYTSITFSQCLSTLIVARVTDSIAAYGASHSQLAGLAEWNTNNATHRASSQLFMPIELNTDQNRPENER